MFSAVQHTCVCECVSMWQHGECEKRAGSWARYKEPRLNVIIAIEQGNGVPTFVQGEIVLMHILRVLIVMKLYRCTFHEEQLWWNFTNAHFKRSNCGVIVQMYISRGAIVRRTSIDGDFNGNVATLLCFCLTCLLVLVPLLSRYRCSCCSDIVRHLHQHKKLNWYNPRHQRHTKALC